MTSPSPRGQYEQRLIDDYVSRRKRLMNGQIQSETASPEIAFELPKADPKSCFRPLSNKRREIMAIVSYRHRLGVKVIRGAGRSAKVVAARHEAMWMMHEYCRMSASQIGIFFGRDHTTVIYALRLFSTGSRKPVGKSQIPGNQGRKPSKSAKFSTAKTVTAGRKSPGREPRRHLPNPALARGPVSMPNVRSARQ